MNDTEVTNEAVQSTETISASTPNEQVKKRKTRTPRPKIEIVANKPQGKKEKLSSRQITGILMLGHSMAAQSFEAPILEIEEEEAESVANAIVDVMQHYDFEASAKTLAWANLVGVLATVYGLKALAAFKSNKVKPNINVARQPEYELHSRAIFE